MGLGSGQMLAEISPEATYLFIFWSPGCTERAV